jgi:hypothetical protein
LIDFFIRSQIWSIFFRRHQRMIHSFERFLSSTTYLINYFI